MNQETHAAVDAGSIKTGVVNDMTFETMAAEIHGYGSEEIVVGRCSFSNPCGTFMCPRCYRGINRPAQDKPLFEAHPYGYCGKSGCCEGHPSLESRTFHDTSYNPNLTGSVDDALKELSDDGIRSKDEYLGAPLSWLMKSSIEPDRRGSGSKGRRHSTTRVPDPAAYLPPMREAAA